MDEARFHSIVERHGAALLRLCSFRERDAQHRRDLYQDMLVAIWEALPRLRSDASERAWVLRIGHNVAASHVDRSARQRLATGEPPAIDAPDPVGLERRIEQRAQLSRLEQRLRTMDVLSQQLVLLHLEGLTTHELAEATGLSATNVTTKLSRIRSQLSEPEHGTGDGGLR